MNKGTIEAVVMKPRDPNSGKGQKYRMLVPDAQFGWPEVSAAAIKREYVVHSWRWITRPGRLVSRLIRFRKPNKRNYVNP